MAGAPPLGRSVTVGSMSRAPLVRMADIGAPVSAPARPVLAPSPATTIGPPLTSAAEGGSTGPPSGASPLPPVTWQCARISVDALATTPGALGRPPGPNGLRAALAPVTRHSLTATV